MNNKGYHLYSSWYLPDTTLSHLILSKTVRGKLCYYLHLTNEELIKHLPQGYISTDMVEMGWELMFPRSVAPILPHSTAQETKHRLRCCYGDSVGISFLTFQSQTHAVCI